MKGRRFGLVLFLLWVFQESGLAQDLRFDFDTKLWRPKIEGDFNGLKLDEESSLAPSFSLGGIAGRHHYLGSSRLGIRYEQASFGSDLLVQNAYFDWDGLRLGGEDVGLTLGGSLRYARAEVGLPSGPVVLNETFSSLFPEIRLKGTWKPHPSLSIEAVAEQGFPLASFGDEKATTLEASLRWRIARGAAFVAGFRQEWLKLEDGSGDGQFDLRMGGPFVALELKF